MLNSKALTTLLLSFSTVPLLMLLIGSRLLAQFFQDLGQTSEELFRGDRLPVLKISMSSESQDG
ncbi:MAG: hypothetical protein IGS50_00020 [Synechococcales cyanobacterium C42_A2020_086]|nr:hypothetical protein [Synechococcales cyanobacterium M58_A2018_015]MBF2072139.1 hypothetical protein [Synechococcales cyanobacterium C42_A2020_086]